MDAWVVIFEFLRQLRDRVDKLERRSLDEDQLADLETGDPDVEHTPSHPLEGGFNGTMIQYIAFVTEILDTNRIMVQKARVCGGASIWAADTSVEPFEVLLPENVSAPAVDDLVLVTFTGLSAIGVGVYGLFGSAGGSKSYLVRSVGENSLICVEVDADGNPLGADEVEIAKPWDLQQQRWDGQTIDGVSYSAVDEQTRSADDGDTAVDQIIIPVYVPDYTIISAITLSGTGVTDVTLMEVSARAFAVVPT